MFLLVLKQQQRLHRFHCRRLHRRRLHHRFHRRCKQALREAVDRRSSLTYQVERNLSSESHARIVATLFGIAHDAR